MKNLYLISLALLVSSFVFCQRNEMKKNEVSISKDEMTGVETKQLNLSTVSFKPMSESSIGLVSSSSEGYLLYSYLYTKEWLFVEKIMIKIDGVLFEFDSKDSRRETMPEAYISEKNWFKPSNEFIDALKNAKEISYRLTGKNYYLDFEIKAKKLEIIKEYF